MLKKSFKNISRDELVDVGVDFYKYYRSKTNVYFHCMRK